ncbi:hypothetical protein SNEBB_010974 [Seison nebaliae]|nr:hypothetical protein SNEBB_010974 [Seison nebaliae]
MIEQMFAGKIEPAKNTHQRLLATKDAVYEMQTHNVIPKHSNIYKEAYGEYVPKAMESYPVVLVGSWRCAVGDNDQFIHIWKYADVPEYEECSTEMSRDKFLQEFCSDRSQWLRSRRTQLCLAFSFWSDVQSRIDKHIYEMRSYQLAPGTMLEWGNIWSRGIKYREEYKVLGLFSQMGNLYEVHHLWAYKSLKDRQDCREAAWKRPGWDRCVQHTVPLIRNMQSTLLIPETYSPLQ